MNNGQGSIPTNGYKQHVPLTKRHLQKLDARKAECYQLEHFKNGFSHIETNGNGYKKDAKER